MAISAPSRFATLAMPKAIERLLSRPVTRIFLPDRNPMARIILSAVRISLILMIFLAGCGEVWNDPYPGAERGKSILYSSFAERPRHLDAVQSYTEDEAVFTQQVYDPLLQYHYLKRPYELIPLTAVEVPKARSIDGGKFTVYEIRIRP